MTEENLPLATIRRFARSFQAYLLAYSRGHDLIKAANFIKEQRSHRCHNKKMDDKMEALYFPLGDQNVTGGDELIQQINGEEFILGDVPEDDSPGFHEELGVNNDSDDDEGEDDYITVGSVYSSDEEESDDQEEDEHDD